MPTVETLRPTVSSQDTAGGGYVLDDAYAFDLSASTYSRIIAETLGDHATQLLSGFPADTYADNRSEVLLKVDLARFGWAGNDVCNIHFRPTAADAWTNVALYLYADLGTVSTAKTIDITALAGTNPATGFQVAIGYGNDVVGEYPSPPRD